MSKHPNQLLLEHFYTCFQNKDYAGMQACYSDDATFNDEAFQNLDATQVRAMWEMLIRNGKDLQLEFKDVSADEYNGSAYWEARYTFSATGRKVLNKIKASFEFENGKIKKHVDRFDFYAWARQAFGLTGVLLGWTPYFHKKVNSTAKGNLARFMQHKSS